MPSDFRAAFRLAVRGAARGRAGVWGTATGRAGSGGPMPRRGAAGARGPGGPCDIPGQILHEAARCAGGGVHPNGVTSHL